MALAAVIIARICKAFKVKYSKTKKEERRKKKKRKSYNSYLFIKGEEAFQNNGSAANEGFSSTVTSL